MAADLDAVRGHIELLRHVKREKARLKEIEDGARSAVQEALGHADEGTLDGEVAVKRTPIKSSRLDQKLLAELYPDVLAECKTVTESTRFDIV